MTDRASWTRLAEQAARDPSRASQIARVLLDRINTEGRTGDRAPQGYLYAGAETLIARTRDLDVETMQTDSEPTGVPIWTSTRAAIPIKIPFDCWIYAVAGWAVTRSPTFVTELGVPGAPLINLGQAAPTAADGRDLFTVDWELDGKSGFSTDGRKRMMLPASVTVGSRLIPRQMSWTLRRNQVIGVRFRNLWNAIVHTMPSGVAPPVLAEAAIAFYAVNLEAP